MRFRPYGGQRNLPPWAGSKVVVLPNLRFRSALGGQSAGPRAWNRPALNPLFCSPTGAYDALRSSGGEKCGLGASKNQRPTPAHNSSRRVIHKRTPTAIVSAAPKGIA